MFNRILVPLDGSRFASRALQYAIEVARRFGAEIVLLQVVAPTITTAGVSPGMENPLAIEIAVQAAHEADKRNVAHAKRYLSGKAQGIRSQGVNESYQVIIGEPVQTIMGFARQQRIDLVVMTTHGKSGLKRAIMGSVADAVIRESGKPVLVVRPISRSK
jgi:nucleotide-binding universal stress UspA family protein